MIEPITRTNALRVGASFKNCVKEILVLKCILHAHVVRQDAHTALAPITQYSLLKEIIQIDGLMCAVKTANADMNGVRAKTTSVVARSLN